MVRATTGGWLVGVVLLALVARGAASSQPSFLTFESGQVRPLALSESGERLLALDTPDGTLEILRVSEAGLQHEASVAVGLEPVAVALRSDDEAWVVNHLSDSVSIVDLSAEPPRVVRTLLVGDEPRDIVFAGENRRRAFVTTARRGQHRSHVSLTGVPGAGAPLLTTPGTPRADVWVFDAAALGGALGGRPLAIVELFGDTPRPLAVSPDGETVYAAVFYSGNGTTTIGEPVVCDGFAATDSADACPAEFPGSPGGNPGPAANRSGAPAPEVGLIVKRHLGPGGVPTGEWRDELGRDWGHALRFDLPDRDVFAIDAASLEPTAHWSGVGTVLFNLAVNPVSGVVYVANTEARNEVRFEGGGETGGTTVQGRLAESRITVLDGADVRPRHLNKHIDYRVRPAPSDTAEHSLATPLDMAVSADGETLYVAAFGSARVGVFDTARLESNQFQPRQASASYLTVSGGGPSGLALDEARSRLYVLTRFDNAVSVIDLDRGVEIQHLELPNPEPPHVVTGRPFLYDARLSSSNGEASCASCHVFGDLDGLAWDLGDPDAEVTKSPIPINLGALSGLIPQINGSGLADDFHPMKGPMTTQTLRGLVNSGAMHWRGDRATGSNGTDPFDSDLSFRNFDVAFQGLLGREEILSPGEMQAFTDFALDLVLPPNPVRALDNSLTPQEANGRRLFFGPRHMDGLPAPDPLGNTCEGCHTLNAASGHFGTHGDQSFELESQIVKIPHMRNLYQKIGMFGNPAVEGILPGDNGHTGDQVRGFGFLHDGSVDTIFRFFRATVFNEAFGGAVGFRNDGERRDMERFALAFDTDLAPVVGQQITLRSANDTAVSQRLDLLLERAGTSFVSKVLGGVTTECDVVARGVVDGEMRGFLYDPSSATFRADRRSESPLSEAQLRALAVEPGQALTFTCAPPGSGKRMALDRDLDGYYDRDELDVGSDPTDPQSAPAGCAPASGRLCLEEQRFEVTVSWKDHAGRTGEGKVVPFGSDDSGLFWFFREENWEMLVKVLDGCGVNQRFWVFAAATTNVEYTLSVRDMATNTTRSYGNPLGVRAATIADTAAFPTCDVPWEASADEASSVARAALSTAGGSAVSTSEAGSCVADDTTLCLEGGRFRVEVDWRDFDDRSDTAMVVPFGSDDSGLFWFFQEENWEMLVKVLDGCGVNGHFWVFGAATTSVEYTLTVTETESGATAQYRKALGTASDAIADTAAFACSL